LEDEDEGCYYCNQAGQDVHGGVHGCCWNELAL
jgi:hypothetical protein